MHRRQLLSMGEGHSHKERESKPRGRPREIGNWKEFHRITVPRPKDGHGKLLKLTELRSSPWLALTPHEKQTAIILQAPTRSLIPLVDAQIFLHNCVKI
jgi:hypothetical protein